MGVRCVALLSAILIMNAFAFWMGRRAYLKATATNPLEMSNIQLFTLNDVSFYHIGAFNTKWVGTAPNEKHVARAFREILEDACSNTVTVLDVGSNTGIYGLYAGMLGCRVQMLDPQPQCQQAIRVAIDANMLEDRATLVPYAATEDLRTVRVTNQSQCLTSLSLAESLNERHADSLAGATWYDAPTVRIDQLAGVVGPVLLMKVDTEGAEYTVLRSAMQWFKSGRIKNLICELTTVWWKKFGIDSGQMVDLWLELWKLGYSDITVLEHHGGRKPFKIERDSQLREFLLTYPHKQVDLWARLK